MRLSFAQFNHFVDSQKGTNFGMLVCGRIMGFVWHGALSRECVGECRGKKLVTIMKFDRLRHCNVFCATKRNYEVEVLRSRREIKVEMRLGCLSS